MARSFFFGGGAESRWFSYWSFIRLFLLLLRCKSSLREWVHFLNRIHLCHHGLAFSNSVFSWVLFPVYIHFMASIVSSYFFIWSIYRPFCWVFLYSIFYSKLFCFLCIQSLVWTRAFATYLYEWYSFVISELSALFFVFFLYPFPVYFLSFANFFESSLQITLSDLSAVFFFCFSFQHNSSFLIILTFHQSSFACPSCLNSNPGFLFLFGFTSGTPILKNTNFTLEYI